jgi:hypothetical protein
VYIFTSRLEIVSSAGDGEMRDKPNDEKTVVLSPHAKETLKRLVQIGISEVKVINTIRNPENLTQGYSVGESLNHRLPMSFCSALITVYSANRRRYE